LKEKALIAKKTKYSLSDKNMKVESRKLNDLIREFEETKKQITKIVEEIAKDKKITKLEEYRNMTEEEITEYLRERIPKELLETFNDNRDFYVLKFRRDCKKQIDYLKKSLKKSR